MEFAKIVDLTKKTPAWIRYAIDSEQDLKMLTSDFLGTSVSHSYIKLENGRKILNRDSNIARRISARANNPETFENFIRAYTHPHKAAMLASKAWAQNSKVLSASDRVLYAVKANEQLNLTFDLKKYVDEVLFEYYKYSPNTVIVIYPDTDENGAKTVRFVEIPPSAIVYLNEDKESNIVSEFLYKDEQFIYGFDKTGYSKHKIERNGMFHSEPEEFGKYWAGNTLPCIRISTRYKNIDSYQLVNFVEQFLGDLEDYFYYAGLQAISTPIVFLNVVERWADSTKCQFSTATAHCRGGYLVSVDSKDNTPILDENGAAMPCPSCNSSIAAGKTIRIQHSPIDGINTMPQAVRFVSPDTNSFESSNKFLTDKANLIFSSLTGINKDLGAEGAVISHITAAEIMAMSDEILSVLNEIRKDIQTPINKLFLASLGVLGVEGADVYAYLGTDFEILTKSELFKLKTETDILGISGMLGIDSMLARAMYPSNSIGVTIAEIKLELAKIFGPSTEKFILLYELENTSIAELVAKKTDRRKILTDIINFSKTVKDDQNTSPSQSGETV